MTDSKIHPPSASRIDDARRSGLAPRPVLAGLAGGLITLLLAMTWQGPALSAALKALLREPLLAFAAGQHERAFSLALAASREVAQRAALGLLILLAGSALALFVAQGPSFGFPRAQRGRFAEPKPSRSLPLLAALVLGVAAASLLRELFWSTPAGFGAVLQQLLVRVTLTLVALAVIDATFARAAFFRALWLTRREQTNELREAHGSPELRAARERVRRESAQGESA